MKLWIFGDSFSAMRQEDLDDCKLLWHEALGKKLSAEVVYKSNFGWSNDYIYKHLIENINNINHDDYVIIQYTEKNRKYFFKEAPQCGNYHALCNMSSDDLLSLGLNKNVKNAIISYIKYLHNEEADELSYHQLLNATGSMMAEIPSNNVRLVPGFGHVNGVKGCLNDVSWNEYKNKNQHFSASQVDKRQNHLSANNHIILAEKLADWFANPGILLDLTAGFGDSFIGE